MGPDIPMLTQITGLHLYQHVTLAVEKGAFLSLMLSRVFHNGHHYL